MIQKEIAHAVGKSFIVGKMNVEVPESGYEVLASTIDVAFSLINQGLNSRTDSNLTRYNINDFSSINKYVGDLRPSCTVDNRDV